MFVFSGLYTFLIPRAGLAPTTEHRKCSMIASTLPWMRAGGFEPPNVPFSSPSIGNKEYVLAAAPCARSLLEPVENGALRKVYILERAPFSNAPAGNRTRATRLAIECHTVRSPVLIGEERIELPTPGISVRCAAKLRHSPKCTP